MVRVLRSGQRGRLLERLTHVCAALRGIHACPVPDAAITGSCHVAATRRALPWSRHGLLEALPSLHLLTTSRQPLGVAEEAIACLDGLSIPDDDLPSPQRYGAVELFSSEMARLLASASGVPERHRSLDAVVDQSIERRAQLDLLSESA